MLLLKELFKKVIYLFLYLFFIIIIISNSTIIIRILIRNKS
jgi:hypothetical protein